MHVRRWAAAIVAISLTGVVAAGCGSSDDSSDTAATGATSKVTQASASVPSGPAFKLGTLGGYTGVQAPSVGAVDDTLQAWVKYTNANGGINGHPVQLIVHDDADNPAKAMQFVREMVEKDKVQALVGTISLVDTTWQKYIEGTDVPVIGAANFNQTFASSPSFFATGAITPTMVYGALEETKKLGHSKLGILPCAETPACAQFAALFTAIGSQVVGGIEVPYTSKITASQPNYTATCLAAKEKGVDTLVVLENAETVKRVADDCARQGYKPTQLNVAATVGHAWTTSPNMDGAIGVVSNPVLAATSSPQIKTIRAALDQYAPGLLDGTQVNEIDVSAWAAAETFKRAAEQAKLTPASTPAEVTDALYGFKDETVGGLTPPLTYAKGKPSFTSCWYTTVIKDQQFTAPDGIEPSCIPPDKLPKLFEVLGG
jgi:branched-chain amino acid transport system substrate-binding protein